MGAPAEDATSSLLALLTGTVDQTGPIAHNLGDGGVAWCSRRRKNGPDPGHQAFSPCTLRWSADDAHDRGVDTDPLTVRLISQSLTGDQPRGHSIEVVTG
ncbi:MAG TPA: hypothetical protein VHZ55_32075 [Bryobacteraceae bacterium]|nr:hypothetical protein [Bryobacteraceae bacterium]